MKKHLNWKKDSDNSEPPCEQPFKHLPVLPREVLDGLNPGDAGIFVDCTVGGGGHARLLLANTAPGVKLVGLDRDPAALRAAAANLAPYRGRYTLARSNFADLAAVLDELHIEAADGFLFDLGVSSYQLDNPARGFSYMHDAPLDMRMDPDGPLTARHLVNELPKSELAAIIREYGEERWAARIASFIARAREQQPVETTAQLVEIIKAAIPAAARREGPHPAKRTFQALRIAVNRELDILPGAIRAAVARLRPGGRICVISFHSLEDRIVKETFGALARPCKCPPKLPCTCGLKPALKLVSRRPVVPGDEEVRANPRARSAKLRVAEKTAPD